MYNIRKLFELNRKEIEAITEVIEKNNQIIKPEFTIYKGSNLMVSSFDSLKINPDIYYNEVEHLKIPLGAIIVREYVPEEVSKKNLFISLFSIVEKETKKNQTFISYEINNKGELSRLYINKDLFKILDVPGQYYEKIFRSSITDEDSLSSIDYVLNNVVKSSNINRRKSATNDFFNENKSIKEILDNLKLTLKSIFRSGHKCKRTGKTFRIDTQQYIYYADQIGTYNVLNNDLKDMNFKNISPMTISFLISRISGSMDSKPYVFVNGKSIISRFTCPKSLDMRPLDIMYNGSIINAILKRSNGSFSVMVVDKKESEEASLNIVRKNDYIIDLDADLERIANSYMRLERLKPEDGIERFKKIDKEVSKLREVNKVMIQRYAQQVYKNQSSKMIEIRKYIHKIESTAYMESIEKAINNLSREYKSLDYSFMDRLWIKLGFQQDDKLHIFLSRETPGIEKEFKRVYTEKHLKKLINLEEQIKLKNAKISRLIEKKNSEITKNIDIDFKIDTWLSLDDALFYNAYFNYLKKMKKNHKRYNLIFSYLQYFELEYKQIEEEYKDFSNNIDKTINQDIVELSPIVFGKTFKFLKYIRKYPIFDSTILMESNQIPSYYVYTIFERTKSVLFEKCEEESRYNYLITSQSIFSVNKNIYKSIDDFMSHSILSSFNGKILSILDLLKSCNRNNRDYYRNYEKERIRKKRAHKKNQPVGNSNRKKSNNSSSKLTEKQK